MAKVTYVQPDGTSRTCVNFEGMTVMHLAVGNLVDGIDALCGGVMQCGTCHCYIAPEWAERVGPPSADEAARRSLIISQTLLAHAPEHQSIWNECCHENAVCPVATPLNRPNSTDADSEPHGTRLEATRLGVSIGWAGVKSCKWPNESDQRRPRARR